VTPVRFAPEVSEELAEAVLWYEARRRGLGNEFLAEMESTLPIIGSRPQSFPRLEQVSPPYEIRRALLPRFPYAIVFLVRVEELRVLAVAHAKRRPGYWLSRVREVPPR
jgi:plasmid stabilization system protein ParE